MTSRLLVDRDWTGVCEYAHFDADGNLVALEWESDIGDVFESNQIIRTDGSGGYGQSREWKHLADVPMGVVQKWEEELGVAPGFLQTAEGFPVLIKKIKDRDNCKVRVDK